MNYIFTMSLSGSLMFLFCLLFDKVDRKYVSEQGRYLMQKATLFFYLVPLMGLAAFYRDMLNYLPTSFNAKPEIVHMQYMEWDTGTDIYINSDYRTLQMVFVIWILVAALILIVKVVHNFVNEKRLLSISPKVEDKQTLELLKQIRKEYGIRRKVRLYQCADGISPFTIGIFAPVIFINHEKNPGFIEMMLRHEAVHIKRNDVLIKKLMGLAICIHWFNPLVYIMKAGLERICELSCDERLMEKQTQQVKACYAKLIVKELPEPNMKVAFATMLSDKGQRAEERIRTIMRKSNRSRKTKVLSGMLMAVMIFANSLTVFAYPQVDRIEKGEDCTSQEEFYVPGEERECVFVPDGMNSEYNVDVVILYEKQFVDEEGNIYPVEDMIETYASCTHYFVPGTLQEHEKHADGSCTTYVYEAQRCMKCRLVLKGALIPTSTVSYVQCPH